MKKILIIKFINHYYPVLTIVFVWIIFSVPYFLKGKVPFPSDYLVSFFPPWNTEYAMPVKNNAMPDIISQIYPWKKLTIDSWKQGSVPLWNPYSFSGTVHAANYQSAVFSPVNLLFFLLPFIDAWSLMILLQPLLAGLFMYFFMRELAVSRPGSLVSAVAFMFCGFITGWMAYGTLAYALLFLPGILWGISRVYRGQLWTGAVSSVFLTLSFFSGHFQISLYVAAVSFLFALAYGAGRNNILKAAALTWIFFGVSGAAIQLFPAFEAYTRSARSTSFINTEVIPWSYLPTFFAPDVFGNPVTRNDWYGHYAEWNGYIGVVPLLLAFIMFFISRRKRELFFLVLAAGGLLLAFDTPANRILFDLKIPAVSTSAASRILSVYAFCMTVLSGFGFDAVFGRAGKKGITFRSPVILTTVLFTAYALFLAVFPRLTAIERQIAARNSILSAGLGAAYVLLILLYNRFRRLRRAVMIALILLTAADLLRFSGKWLPFADRGLVYPQSGVLNYLDSRDGYDRVFGNFGNEINGRVSLQLVEGYDAMYRERYGRFITMMSGGQGLSGSGRSVVLLDKGSAGTKAILDLLGVRYLVHRISDGRNEWAYPFWNYPDSMKLLYSDTGYEVYENLDAYPRAFLVDRYRLVEQDAEIAEMMFREPGVFRTDAVLRTRPQIEPAAGAGRAEIISYSPSRVVIRTESESDQILVLTDVYDAGWKAYVDGRKTPLLEADYILRAVSVPAGDHVISLKYEPATFMIGAGITAISFGVMVVLVPIGKRYENRFV